ncbi:MAG: hypothetical protein FJY83_08665 [Candidatus Aminicenantes bacterium]|nr:hypothetical protein [Candidatus Aminicenantes bacterium]
MSGRKTVCCPPKETLVSVFQGEMSLSRRTKVYRHVVECPDCSRKIELLRSLREDLREKIDALCDSAENKPRIEGLQADGAQGAARPRRFLRKFALPAAAALALCLAFVFVWKWTQNESEFRGTHTERLILKYPVGIIEKPPSYLQWTPVRSAEFYFIHLADDGLNTLLDQSHRETRFEITDALSGFFRSGASYSWTVTAYDDAHNKLAQESSSFTIRPAPPNR